MKDVKPIYAKLLVAAIVIYVICTTIMLSDIYRQLGEVQHILAENSIGHSHHH